MTPNPSPFPPGSSVVAYLRDSGGEDQDLSTEQQEASIRSWCAENNLKLSNIFTDVARPGSSVVTRTEFTAMMDHFHTKGCPDAGVILWKYSRFSRDFDDATYFKADLRRLGFLIFSINDNIPDTIEGRVFESMIDYMNHRFLEDLSTDIKRGLHHIVREYGALPGLPPPGFKREPVTIGSRRDGKPHTVSRWVIDPETAPLVRQAFQMRAQGCTIREINNKIHLLKTRSPYNLLFQNRIYLGELNFSGQVFPNYSEPIIDQKTWDVVQSINQKNKLNNHVVAGENSPSHPRRLGSEFLLSGLVYCARCGQIMTAQVVNSSYKKRYEYYICNSRSNKMDCNATAVPRSAVENQVIEQISNYILNPQIMINKETNRSARLAARQQELQAEIKATEQTIATLKRRVANLTNQLADDPDAPRSILSSIKEMERDLDTQQGNLDRLNSRNPGADVRARTPADIQQLSEKMLEVMASEDTLTKKTFIKMLVNRVIVEVQIEGKRAFLRGMTYFYGDEEPTPDLSSPDGVDKMNVMPMAHLSLE